MDMPTVDQDDPVMVRVRAEFERLKEADGWTLDRLGLAMGFAGATARKAAHQFLGSRVPRIDTLRKFAAAVGVSLADLVTEGPKTGRPAKHKQK